MSALMMTKEITVASGSSAALMKLTLPFHVLRWASRISGVRCNTQLEKNKPTLGLTSGPS